MSSGIIYKKIPAIMAEVGAIGKDRKNAAQNYAFRGIDDFYFAMQPVLAKHGVFCAPSVLRDTREERQTKSGANMIYTVLAMEFTFYAEDGSSFKVSTIGEAMDSGDKSAAKAMSTALKYAFMQLFCVPTEEDGGKLDTENDSPESLPKFPSPSKPTPANPNLQVVGATETCPKCAGKMMVSKYPSKENPDGPPPFYCTKCKVTVPRSA